MTENAIAFAEHDHRRCRQAMLDELRRSARSRGLRLTPVRTRVLEILSEAHRAMGAYEILDRLREDGLGSQPPVAYRALEFLSEAGFVHRIERLNAYVACCQPGGAHGACFLICAGCRKVAEIEDGALDIALAQTAAARGFAVRRTILEIEGICPNCRGDTAGGSA